MLNQRVLLLILLFSTSVSAEVKIRGNKRTQSFHIQRLYKECQQNNQDQAQCLLNSKLFSKVDIEQNGNDTIITVADRWTLLPIPFARTDRGEKKAGIFLFERNFLGLGKIAVFGGVKGDRSDSIFIMYRDPFLFNSSNSGSLHLKINDSTPHQYMRDKTINAHRIKSSEIQLGIGKKNKFIFYELALGITKNSYELVSPYSATPSESNALKLYLTVAKDLTSYKFYFQEGLRYSIRINSDLTQSSRNHRNSIIDWRFDYQKSIIYRHVLQFHHFITTNVNQSNMTINYMGGEKGLRGVNQQGLWAKSASGISLDYQLPISDQSYGTWSIGPFVDYSIFSNYDQKGIYKESYGSGIGGHLFLKKIALPGLGILIGTNPKFENKYITASIGRSI